VVDAYIRRVVGVFQDAGDAPVEVHDTDVKVVHSDHPDPWPLDRPLHNGDEAIREDSLVEEAHEKFRNMSHDDFLQVEVEVDSTLQALP
jgi:hypothetical protein